MKLAVRLMICLMISATLVKVPMMQSAHAGMISTNVIVEDMTRTQTQDKVIEFMERSDVQNQMIDLGVSPEEASVRVAGLTDPELNQIAGEIDNSVAGGDVGGILVIALVVILILYLVKRI